MKILSFPLLLPLTLFSLSFPWVFLPYTSAWMTPKVIRGNKFFTSNENDALEYRIRGVAYMPRPNTGELDVNSYDFFSDEYESVWSADLKYFKTLHINTLRIYSIDPTKSHDKFMCALSNLHISVIVDTGAECEHCAVPKVKPPTCYTAELLQRNHMIYNAFAVYDNLLAFSVGNENNYDGGMTAPCVKALLRDLRTYAKGCKNHLREVPIGLVHADKLPRSQWIDYYDCMLEKDENTRAEWQGWNQYVECEAEDNREFKQSAGMKELITDFQAIKYSHPIIMTEFGCNTIVHTVNGIEQQRMWDDAKWINEEPALMALFAGGVAFEYSTEAANAKSEYPFVTEDIGRYGLGYFSPKGCDHVDTPCKFTPYPEFSNLARSFNTTKPSTLRASEYQPSKATVKQCPKGLTTTLPPSPKVQKMECSARRPICNGKAPMGIKNSDGDESSAGRLTPVTVSIALILILAALLTDVQNERFI